MMKHFYSDGSGLFQDDSAPIHRALGVTEWFDGYENDVTHMLWPNPIEHLWEILDRRVQQHSPPPLSTHQMKEYLLEEWCSIPPVEFQSLEELMPRRAEAVLAARGSPTSY